MSVQSKILSVFTFLVVVDIFLVFLLSFVDEIFAILFGSILFSYFFRLVLKYAYYLIDNEHD